MSAVTFDEWRWQATSLLELRVGASWDDLCGEDEELLSSFQCGWTPREFCDWFITKYDLIELSDINFGT